MDFTLTELIKKNKELDEKILSLKNSANEIYSNETLSQKKELTYAINACKGKIQDLKELLTADKYQVHEIYKLSPAEISSLLKILKSGKAETYEQAHNIHLQEKIVELQRELSERDDSIDELEDSPYEHRALNLTLDRPTSTNHSTYNHSTSYGKQRLEELERESEKRRYEQARKEQERIDRKRQLEVESKERQTRQAEREARSKALQRCCKCANRSACGKNRGNPNCGAFVPEFKY